jgi:hypothetical protein
MSREELKDQLLGNAFNILQARNEACSCVNHTCPQCVNTEFLANEICNLGHTAPTKAAPSDGSKVYKLRNQVIHLTQSVSELVVTVRELAMVGNIDLGYVEAARLVETAQDVHTVLNDLLDDNQEEGTQL